MSRELSFPGFNREEINEQDNCVFFAVFEYVFDQYSITLTRTDFENFLKRKKIQGANSGIEYVDIPSVIDTVLKPYGLRVDAILIQEGLKKHFLRQMRDEKVFENIKTVLFLLDRRIVTTSTWTFPFIAWLVGESDMDHLEYIPEGTRYERALAKVEGNQGRIPTGYKIGMRSRS